MSHRAARSRNIPIPAPATLNRNIEDVILVPFIASPGSLSGSHLLSSSHSPLVHSPTRSLPRQVSSQYEPRIIRASPPRSVDMSCVSTSPISASYHHRRPSPSSIPLAPIPSPRNFSTSRTIFNTTQPSTAVSISSFPRPEYLEHSALRHLLQTETSANLPPSRYKPDGAHFENSHSAANQYPYIRREITPDSDDEGSLSPPRELPPPVPSSGVASFNPILRLPTRWSDLDRNSSLSVSADGRELSFVGTSSVGDKEAAAARTNHAVPPACGIYYYEVEILNKGQKGHISIGFSGPEVKLSRLPGWEKFSWGYRGDDGYSFAAERAGAPYGPTYTTGDVVGCGIDFSQNKLFYTKNGALLGSVFDNVGKDCELYPSIGLRHQMEAVKANFGHDPFQYDIEDHVHQQRNQVWSTIQNTPLDDIVLQRINEDRDSGILGTDLPYSIAVKNSSSATNTNSDMIQTPAVGLSNGDWSSLADKERNAIDNLALSYLTHHGYIKTARALKEQCRDESSATVNKTKSPLPPLLSLRSGSFSDDKDLRTKIVKSVINGDIDTALEDAAMNYPGVLEKEQGFMLFRLRCRKFIELLLESAETLKRVNQEKGEVIDALSSSGEIECETLNADIGVDGMDVDEDAFRPFVSSTLTNGFVRTLDASIKPSGKRRPSVASTTAAQTALQEALSYGQQLETDYKSDIRPEVRTHLKRTFSVVAYEDPLSVGGDIGEIAGQEARELLATELNKAILESQGKPTRPALEIVYRQTAACLQQLGLMGVGAAVFADIQKELSDS